jgi:hypothetical protein
MVEVKAPVRVERLVGLEAGPFAGAYPTSRLTEQHPV